MHTKNARRLLLLLLILWCPIAAMGQGVAVRSGEHATFSRLVFPDTLGRTWKMEIEEQTHRIVFSAGVPVLDLSGIFELIPRKRLRAANYTDGVLELRLACDCPVRITQIATGHIVIDVEDRPFKQTAVPATRFTLPPLPLAGLPLIAGLLAPAVKDEAHSQITTEQNGEAPQFHRHPMGRVPLLLPALQEENDENFAGICAVEAMARRVLTADPDATLASLPDLRGALLNGQDKLETNTVSQLVETYLALGWGAEARLISRSASLEDDLIKTLAAAFDGRSTSSGDAVDPGCGPASAVIALLTAVERGTWGRADETRVVKFLDTLPGRRMDDIYPRLEEALRRLDRVDLLIGFRQPEPAPPGVPPATPPSAGTDASAIADVIATLTDANTAGVAVDTLTLENARALRPSIPPGETRDALDRLLLESLILARRPTAAFAMIEDSQATPDTYVDLVQDRLSPEEATVFLVRLGSILSLDDALRLRLRDTFLDLGLTATAQRFVRPGLPNAPQVEINPIVETDPWLARDFAALAETPVDGRSARNDVASLIRSRNGTSPSAGDLATADMTLGQSRDLRDALRRLVAAP